VHKLVRTYYGPILSRNRVSGKSWAIHCVYVGQTGQSLTTRTSKHRKGKFKGKNYVKRYGFGRPFLRELFEHLNPCLKEDALKHERELAEALRSKGYTVTGGH
jgi:predicted GIY-YIG superfamily endonuclease